MAKNNDIDGAYRIMEMFVKGCGYNEANVHDNQTMWFEHGMATGHYRKQEWRQALKEWSFVFKHIDNIISDQFDYYFYSLRKYTLSAYEEMIELSDSTLYQNKTVVKSAIGMLKLAKKVEKIAEAERPRFKPELENYLASDDYKALFKNQDKMEDEEDEYKKDMDP